MIKKLVLGVAVCCWISEVSGMNTMNLDSHDSEMIVPETPSSSPFDDKRLCRFACDAVGNEEGAYRLISDLSDDRLSADIVDSVYWDLRSREQDYTERYSDFMEILNLLDMVHYAKCEGRCLQEELLLNAYKRGEFKHIEAGGPFDEFEP